MSDLPPPAVPPVPEAWPPVAPDSAPVPPGPPASYSPAPVPPPVYQAPDPNAPPAAPPIDAQGVMLGTFASRKVAKRVVLEVDGAFYECSTTAPTDPLLAAVEARETKNHWALMQALRTLVPAVMFPEARVRYEARLAGQTDEGGPIDPTEFLAHGLWLVGAYFGTPTEGSAPSGAGPATPP